MKRFIIGLALGLGLGVIVGTVQAVVTPSASMVDTYRPTTAELVAFGSLALDDDRAVGVGMLQRGTDYHNRMTADLKRVTTENKKPCRTKKSTRCTWADSYHYGDTLSWWRASGSKWNVTNKRARDRITQWFRAHNYEHVGAIKFGGTLHPYCWWNPKGTAVLCGDGARKYYG